MSVGLGSSPACIIALNTRNGAGLTLNSDANITSPECGVEVHAQGNPAFIINGGVNLAVPQSCIAGDDIVDNNGTADNIQTGCSVNPDPYLGAFEAPDTSHCDYNSKNFDGGEWSGGNVSFYFAEGYPQDKCLLLSNLKSGQSRLHIRKSASYKR